jgi:1,4-alpha-glucan branching enzyme
VAHGKGSLLRKMSGDAWQRLANLRLLFAWQALTPGKKLTSWAANSASSASGRKRAN